MVSGGRVSLKRILWVEAKPLLKDGVRERVVEMGHTYGTQTVDDRAWLI